MQWGNSGKKLHLVEEETPKEGRGRCRRFEFLLCCLKDSTPLKRKRKKNQKGPPKEWGDHLNQKLFPEVTQLRE